MLDLALAEIKDEYVRENFRRIQKFLSEQLLLDGNWKIFRLSLNGAVSEFRFKHNMKFIPKHVLLLSAEGSKDVTFHQEIFTHTHLFLSTGGATEITFLAGMLKS